MLEVEFQYFLDHKDELIEKFNGKFIVIMGTQVVGVYDSEIDAYNSSKEKYELGTFLIQQCIEGKDSYNQTFHTRAIFH